MSNLDLREASSGVEIHLGMGDYPGYRVDRLFGATMALVAAPEIATTLKKPEDLANHLLLHDDAMDLVAGGDAWRKWLEAAGAEGRVDAGHGPRFSTNALSLEAASQKLGVALALRPLVDADIRSGRLIAPFQVELKPVGAYFLICPEVIADRPAVAAFRKWLLKEALTP
jgi:LysR family glycine cleavage system transcriptional activator